MALRDNLINKMFKEEDPINPELENIEQEVNPDTVESATVEESSPYTGGFYQNAYTKLHKDIAPESELDKKARLKREKYRSVITALGDGIGDIANIWGASKGATAMDLTSLSDVNRQRVEYARNVRDRNKDAWRRGMFSSLNMDRQEKQRAAEQAEIKAERERSWKYKLERDGISDDRYEKQEGRASESHDWNRDAEGRAVESHKTSQDIAKQNLEFGKENQTMKRENHKEQLANNKARTEAYVTKTLGGTATDGTKPYKTEYFGVSDPNGVIVDTVEVPKDLVDSYTANVFRKLVESANEEDQDIILSLMENDLGITESTPSKQRNAINLYANKHPEVVDFMKHEAKRVRTQYEKTLPTVRNQTTPGNNAANTIVPGLEGSATTSNPEIITEEEQELFDKWGAQ